MDKEQQNIAWESIPKDVRTLLRQEYAKPIIDDFSEGYNSALNDTFGDENLTSDEEPEEIFMVSAKKVRELHAKAVKSCANDEDGDLYYSGYIEALEDAFGKDKCLPDPSEEKPTPKFKVGDKVTMVDEAKISYNGVGTIIEVSNIHRYAFYRIKECPVLFAEQYLEPYTEPEQTEENMEEKELNLTELLKDYIGDTFFHPHYGDVELVSTDNGIHLKPNEGGDIISPSTGCYSTGMAYLYPDAESMKKYPFDGVVAWQIWAEERKPKRWRAKNGEHYYRFDAMFSCVKEMENGGSTDNTYYGHGNYFQTREECFKAAEAVKRTLEEYHEKKAEK